MLNFTLMALLEANGAKTKTKPEDEDPADTTEDPAPEDDTDTKPEENPTEDNSDNDDNDNTDNQDEENQDEDEDPNKEEENQDENNPDDENKEDDDFSLDPEEGADDSGENPDGLPDPDDDGSGDDSGTEDGEVNVHTNILQLSKLDRLMAKRQCFSDYQNLRTSITSFKNMIDANEATIEPAIRDYVIEKLDFLYTTVTDYLTYKFSYINYEENLQNYLIFMKTLNDLIRYVQTNGAEGKPKSSGKKTLDSSETRKKAKEKPKTPKKKKDKDKPEDDSEEPEEEPEDTESDETI